MAYANKTYNKIMIRLKWFETSEIDRIKPVSTQPFPYSLIFNRQWYLSWNLFQFQFMIHFEIMEIPCNWIDILLGKAVYIYIYIYQFSFFIIVISKFSMLQDCNLINQQ